MADMFDMANVDANLDTDFINFVGFSRMFEQLKGTLFTSHSYESDECWYHYQCVQHQERYKLAISRSAHFCLKILTQNLHLYWSL